MKKFPKIPVAMLMLALGMATLPARAAQHPVPLDPKTDSAKCLECHEEKGKGKAIHSAIQMGCTSCHEIRVNKDVTRVKLITTTTQALCITCHSDKKPLRSMDRFIPRPFAIASSVTIRIALRIRTNC